MTSPEGHLRLTKTVKIPTADDFANYDGGACGKKWEACSSDWRCPACGRTKFQIMYWTTRRFKLGVGKCPPYEAWLWMVHQHHDHGQPMFSPAVRFPDTIICDLCNTADGAAKRKLGLPEDFSFSPAEIGQFVKPTPHGKHVIDYDKAQEIYDRIVREKESATG